MMRTICQSIGLSAVLVLAWVGWLPEVASAAKPHAAPPPFLYRPYYGPATVLSRSASLFDHDKPWYAPDNVFVRYDGQRFAGGASTNCQPYVSCYDGHNGYDLNMAFEPVLAAGAGTVIRAGWYNPTDHSDGFGLWAAIDHGNGYYSAYGHLSAVNVTVGQTVAPQWQIGTSGSSGSATGPHLHFSVFTAGQWQPTDPFGWQDVAGQDPNVIPDNYLWVGAPGAQTQSPNLGGTGAAPYPGAIVIDDRSSGFTTTGTWQSATGSGLVSAAMRWTATVPGAATATATWRPSIPTTGYYAVGVYITPIDASSQWAPYTITSIGPDNTPRSTTVYVDQQHIGIFQGPFGTVDTGPRWVSLGTYRFTGGTGGGVMVSNGTGEQGQQVGADAVEFVAVPNWTPTGQTPPNLTPGQHRHP